MKNLLEIRRKLKARKPKFVREDSHKKKSLRNSGWRKPKGWQSKLRLHVKGHREVVQSGYRSPKAVRGFHKLGLKPVIVHNALELKKIDTKIEGAIIAKVGLRKKLEIVKEAQAAKITILNLKDPAKFLEETNKKLDARKKEKEEKEKSKKEKPKKTAEKAEAEKKEEISEEENQKKEKEEKDKLLIKRK